MNAAISSVDICNEALAQRYDEIPYEALPHPATHPLRLASIASFVGHDAPRPQQCSVLEVGCSSGSNLIPMAVSLPGARFVGCDLSQRAIEEGGRTIAALGLNNITLVEADLAQLAPEHGEFDFIVAHGVYSWVPPAVRDALLALAADRLTPNGIVYVSFNVLPGCRVRQAAWDVLHHHVDHLATARERLDAARQLARLLADGGAATVASDEALRAEFRAIAQRSDSELCHDDLAAPNEPVLFQSFAQHAARHGLRYLADAELHSAGDGAISADALAYLATLDPLAYEQYLDFVRLRRFRQSLLVRAAAPVDSLTAAQRVRRMHVSASWELTRAGAAGAIHKLARRLDPAGGGGGPLRRLLEDLVAQHPTSRPVAALADTADLQALMRPLEIVLAEAYSCGIVDLHVQATSVSSPASDRPMASPLARLQAQSRSSVTTLLHMPVSIADNNVLQLLPLVDGTRDRAALTAAVIQLALNIEASRAGEFVKFALDKLARLGLLMAEVPLA